MSPALPLRCSCGQVGLTVERAPIASVECCCNSCRAAGERLQALPGASELLDPHGATRFVMYRKDRVRFVSGLEHLKEFRLSATSGTRRVVAACCNTPLFLELKGGHWLSLYGGLWPAGTLPALEMRTMTGDLADASILPADVPNHKRQSMAFFASLLGAWIAMGFRNPEIVVAGELNA